MMNTEISAKEAESGADTQPNVLSVSGDFDPAQPYTELWMRDGRVVRVPTAVLLPHPSGDHTAVEGNKDLEPGDSLPIVVPILEERLEVEKRTIATGVVRLHKTVQEYTQALDEVLAVRTFDIERVILNVPVESAPPIRQEGDATIYSLVEEQLVLTKQLILKEEVRVIQRDSERIDTQSVTLHKEHLTVERQTLG